MRKKSRTKRLSSELDEEVERLRKIFREKGVDVKYISATRALANMLKKVDVVLNIEKGKKEAKGSFTIKI